MITKEFCDEWDGVGLNVKDMIEHFMDSESMFLKYLYKFFDSADSVVLELTSAAEREDYQQRREVSPVQKRGERSSDFFHTAPPFSSTVTQVPLPTRLAKDIVPLCSCTISLHSDRPRPTPPCARERDLSTR